MAKGLELSLKGDAFLLLKNDFDLVLERTVNNMKAKGSDEATITLKLNISLEKGTNFTDEDEIEVDKPTFSFDISSVMQVKDKKSGVLGGDYYLDFDDKSKKYVMRRIGDKQKSMFE